MGDSGGETGASGVELRGRRLRVLWSAWYQASHYSLLPPPPQVRKLQAVLQPILLRRMKEDVETLPEKEEVSVWVQLTVEQRQYYK